MTNPDYRALCAELHKALEKRCELSHLVNTPEEDRLLDRSAAALAQEPVSPPYKLPQPVAVGERLPGPEDCLDEGWAWFFNKLIGWRQAVLPVSPGYTHWLPANALPIPLPISPTTPINEWHLAKAPMSTTVD